MFKRFKKLVKIKLSFDRINFFLKSDKKIIDRYFLEFMSFFDFNHSKDIKIFEKYIDKINLEKFPMDMGLEKDRVNLYSYFIKYYPLYKFFDNIIKNDYLFISSFNRKSSSLKILSCQGDKQIVYTLHLSQKITSLARTIEFLVEANIIYDNFSENQKRDLLKINQLFLDYFNCNFSNLKKEYMTNLGCDVKSYDNTRIYYNIASIEKNSLVIEKFLINKNINNEIFKKKTRNTL